MAKLSFETKIPFSGPPIPPASMFFSAGLQENNFEIGGVRGVGGDNKCLEIFCLLPLIYGKDCLNSQKKQNKKKIEQGSHTWKSPNLKKASQFYSNLLAAILTFTWPKQHPLKWEENSFWHPLKWGSFHAFLHSTKTNFLSGKKTNWGRWWL